MDPTSLRVCPEENITEACGTIGEVTFNMPGFITGYLSSPFRSHRARRRARQRQQSTIAESSQDALETDEYDLEYPYISFLSTLQVISDLSNSYTSPSMFEPHVRFVLFRRPPATPWIISNLDSNPADEEMIGNDSSSSCSICLEKFTVGIEVSVLSCKHIFHTTCVRRWICESNSCPTCREGRAVARGSISCLCGCHEARF